MSTSRVLPRQPAPALQLPLVGGGTFTLADRRPAGFTMLVFNRGLHCPVCRAQLSELNRRTAELTERGIEVVSVSAETEARATQMREEWKLANVPIAYGLSEAQMREWGLYVSKAIADGEPPTFNEPGLFLIQPDAVVYYASVLSMPAGRPHLDDLFGGLAFWTEHDYPARGDT